MPYTFNGFGTRYYRRREKAEDGSYVTTMWITALYVPLFPLGSYRVRSVGKGTNYVIHSSQSYKVLRVPICWEQIWHVYMIGLPVLILFAMSVWSSEKQDRAKRAFQSRLNTAGAEVTAARKEADRLQSDCMQPLQNSRNKAQNGFFRLRQDLHDRCTPAVSATENYEAKIDGITQLIATGLSNGSVDDNDRPPHVSYQRIWGIRRHQAEELKGAMLCFQNLTHDCYEGVSPTFDSIDAEDKQVCTLLADINEKCE